MNDRSSQKLATRILIGLGVGAVLGTLALAIGHAYPDFLAACVRLADAVLDPIGQVFLRLLFFVVIPLVFASLTLGIVQLSNLSKLGPLAGRTALFFFANMAIGVKTSTFTEGLRMFFYIDDVISGILKAATFGIIIGLMGCYNGFRTFGGAKGVGDSTMHAVVTSCICILITNYFLASVLFRVIFYRGTA